MANGCEHDYQLRPGLDQVFKNLDAEIAAQTAQSNVTYISQVAITDFDMDHDFMDCTTLHWADGDHWSLSGASRFVGRLLDDEQFLAAMGRDPTSQGVSTLK